ncbi:hypothetical protein J23TS9_19740 [Paenibacillus sp. J23TS9]|uniref:hypothetical protein n=1 Tax=Paenibacillus sp. J23TS9 TaxID=2807193 RepID=UPI001B179C3D|nr:hypothetical protein [Paenibacillus sp. J23TS9]GIP26844.1 hypothetical protein J23TS9_19740 [Paenibacillus sp. J23TS9]
MTFKVRPTKTIISMVAILLIASSIIFGRNFAESKESKTIQVINHPDYAVSGDVNGLVKLADYVVTGHYEKFLENWDMGENYYSDVYQFVIDKVNYGDLSGNINVAIPHYQQRSTVVDNQQYEANIDLPNYTQPEMGQQYVLFLKKYEPKNIFTPASVPFQVEIDKSSGVSKLIFNNNITKQEVKTKNNDTIVFSTESIDIGSIDKVSGLNNEELEQQITKAILLKN